MDNEKSNLLKMVYGTFAVALIFALACAFVFIFLPEQGTSVAVGTSAASAESSAAPVAEEFSGETVELGQEVSFMGDIGAETDVSGEMSFSEYSSNADNALVLYRSAETRGYVEWFYTRVTGDRDIALAILDAAAQFNVAPSLAFALAHTESNFKTDAKHTNVNGSVDRGLFQLNSYSFTKLSEEEFFDAATSAYYGMSHLSYCLEMASNQIAGLAMYNAGRNKVQGDKTPQSTLNYIAKIMDYKENLESKFASEVLAYYSDGNGSGSENVSLVKY